MKGGSKREKEKVERRSKKLEREEGARDVDRGLVTRFFCSCLYCEKNISLKGGSKREKVEKRKEVKN